MKLFVSVINHGHDSLITANDTLANLANSYNVVIRSNTTPSAALQKYADDAGIHLVCGEKPLGFASNNNAVFKYCQETLGMVAEDYFLVLNPDVEVLTDSVTRLVKQAQKYQADISTINLFTDSLLMTYDNSIRRYPNLFSPLKSLIGLKRKDIYDKSQITAPLKIEWAAGSFLLFKVNCFNELKGFDEKYFMYFEDADICTRANENGFNVYYFPNIKAVHYASHQNRKLLSMHFIWYLKSSLRYQLS
ncbi:glycosyltransferase [Enterovibrio baiacu]|uniref:glycosyltransferase n=1 Tax=Enterovibrio baiacu TaxID=2491023 RepID=UPI001013884F|nr:glycosyltransferase family 2 protein [Enterovibrio baiacu]MBE1274802.1 glycosyltransferase family 2 protein [Enterovibrio baiacu]